MHDPFLQLRAGGRGDRAGHARHVDRDRVRPHADDARRSRATTSRATRSGRFVLGLGSQVKPHIERRFSMPWSHPAPRMREFVHALRAIWASWQDGDQARLPGRVLHAHADDAVLLPARARVGTAAGVPRGRRQAHDRGRGRGVRRLLLPRLHHAVVPARGHAARARCAVGPPAGTRALDGFDIAGPAFTCVADTEEGLAEAIQGTKQQIAFYASTPAYRGGARPPRLGRPATRAHAHVEGRQVGRRWPTSSTTTSSAPSPRSATSRPSRRELRERWEGAATRLSFYAPYQFDDRAAARAARRAQVELS